MVATYYFSGLNKPSFIAMLARQGASGMLNALSAGEPKLRQAYERYPVELVLDSGAVQGNRNVEGYARLIRQLGPRLTFCSNLDMLHNQQMSDENFRQRHKLLADDEQVRNKLLWIYQYQSRGDSWHPQGDRDALKRAVANQQMIGIGGFVSVIQREILEAQDLLASLGEILDGAGAQAHIFGLGNYTLLNYCVTQQWFRSADSARWLQGLKSRTLLTKDGRVINGTNLTFSGAQCAEQNVGAVMTWLEPRPTRQLYLFPLSDSNQTFATDRASHMQLHNAA